MKTFCCLFFSLQEIMHFARFLPGFFILMTKSAIWLMRGMKDSCIILMGKSIQ